MVYRVSGYVLDKQRMVDFVCNNIERVPKDSELPPLPPDSESTRTPQDQICGLLFSDYLDRTFHGRIMDLRIFRNDESGEWEFFVPTTVIRRPEGYQKPESELDIVVRDLIGSIEGDPLDVANMKYITRTERSESLQPHLEHSASSSTMVYRVSGYVLDKQKMVDFVCDNIERVPKDSELPPLPPDSESTRTPQDQICGLLFSDYLDRKFHGRVMDLRIFRNDESGEWDFFVPTMVIRRPEGYQKPESELDIVVRDLIGSIEGDPLDAANMKYITRTERSLRS